MGAVGGKALAEAARDGDAGQARRVLERASGSAALLLAAVEYADEQGIRALHIASAEGHLSVVALLLEQAGASINCTDNTGATPLMFAARYNRPKVVELLLSHSARADLFTYRDHFSALMWASVANSVACIKVLLNRGNVPVDLPNATGKTALWVAASANRTDAASLLLKFHADVNHADIDGTTPLMISAKQDACDVLPTLLEYKANVYAVDNARTSAIEYAKALKKQRWISVYEEFTHPPAQNAHEALELSHEDHTMSLSSSTLLNDFQQLCENGNASAVNREVLNRLRMLERENNKLMSSLKSSISSKLHDVLQRLKTVRQTNITGPEALLSPLLSTFLIQLSLFFNKDKRIFPHSWSTMAMFITRDALFATALSNIRNNHEPARLHTLVEEKETARRNRVDSMRFLLDDLQAYSLPKRQELVGTIVGELCFYLSVDNILRSSQTTQEFVPAQSIHDHSLTSLLRGDQLSDDEAEFKSHMANGSFSTKISSAGTAIVPASSVAQVARAVNKRASAPPTSVEPLNSALSMSPEKSDQLSPTMMSASSLSNLNSPRRRVGVRSSMSVCLDPATSKVLQDLSRRVSSADFKSPPSSPSKKSTLSMASQKPAKVHPVSAVLQSEDPEKILFDCFDWVMEREKQLWLLREDTQRINNELQNCFSNISNVFNLIDPHAPSPDGSSVPDADALIEQLHSSVNALNVFLFNVDLQFQFPREHLLKAVQTVVDHHAHLELEDINRMKYLTTFIEQQLEAINTGALPQDTKTALLVLRQTMKLMDEHVQLDQRLSQEIENSNTAVRDAATPSQEDRFNSAIKSARRGLWANEQKLLEKLALLSRVVVDSFPELVHYCDQNAFVRNYLTDCLNNSRRVVLPWRKRQHYDIDGLGADDWADSVVSILSKALPVEYTAFFADQKCILKEYSFSGDAMELDRKVGMWVKLGSQQPALVTPQAMFYDVGRSKVYIHLPALEAVPLRTWYQQEAYRSVEQVRLVVFDVLKALEILHLSGCAYGTLRADHILVSDNRGRGLLRDVDFRIWAGHADARVQAEDIAQFGRILQAIFIPSNSRKQSLSSEVNVASLSRSNSELVRNVTTSTDDSRALDGIAFDDHFLDLVPCMTVLDAQMRLSATECLAHPFCLRSVAFSMLRGVEDRIVFWRGRQREVLANMAACETSTKEALQMMSKLRESENTFKEQKRREFSSEKIAEIDNLLHDNATKLRQTELDSEKIRLQASQYREEISECVEKLASCRLEAAEETSRLRGSALVPSYWIGGGGSLQDYLVADELIGEFQNLMDTSLGSVAETPRRLLVQSVHRIENSWLWTRYAERVADLRLQPMSFDPITVESHRPWCDTALCADLSVNETFLFASVQTLEDVHSVKSTGFASHHQSKQPVIGGGFWLTENSALADELSEAETSDGEFYLFFARVALGQPHIALSMPKRLNYNEPYCWIVDDSRLNTLVLEKQANQTQAAEMHYRKYAVSSTAQVYPEFLICYRRDDGAS